MANFLLVRVQKMTPRMWACLVTVLLLLLSLMYIYTWWPVSPARQLTGVVMVAEQRWYTVELPNNQILCLGAERGTQRYTSVALDSTEVALEYRTTGFFTHPTGIVQTCFADDSTLAVPTDGETVRQFLSQKREEVAMKRRIFAERAEELTYFLDTHAQGDEGYDLIRPLVDRVREDCDKVDSLLHLVDLALDSEFSTATLHRSFLVTCSPQPSNDVVRHYPARLLRPDGQVQLATRRLPEDAYFFNTSQVHWWSRDHRVMGYFDYFVGGELPGDTLPDGLCRRGPQWIELDSCRDGRMAEAAMGAPVVDGHGGVRGLWTGKEVRPLGRLQMAPSLWWNSICQWMRCLVSRSLPDRHNNTFRVWRQGDSLRFEGLVDCPPLTGEDDMDSRSFISNPGTSFLGYQQGRVDYLHQGGVYRGYLYRGMRDGMGIFCDSIGRRYWGIWDGDSLPLGYCQWGDTLYEGQMDRHLRFCGEGTLTTPLSYYAGAWADGQRNGFGFDFSPGKILRSGTWEQDKFMGEQLLYTSSRVYGIDISRYQHEIKRRRYGIAWDRLRITRLSRRNPLRVDGIVDFPVSFCYIKATQGVTITSRYYAADAQSARKRGIAVGAYHFFSPTNGAKQATYFLNFAKPKRGDLPPVLDVELSARQISRMGGSAAMLREVLAWLRLVRARTGTLPVLYVSQAFINRYFEHAPAELHEYPVWIARYSQFKPYVRMLYWQISPEGAVRGITGDVDIDVFNGTKAQFQEYLHKNCVK